MALRASAEEPRGREQAYEPPRAEDIDTTDQPAETLALVVGCVPRAVEESNRWH